MACSCTPQSGQEQARQPGGLRFTPVPAGQPVLEVRFAIPEIKGRFRHEAETTGLVLALLEAGLADLSTVAPVVAGAPVSPGLEQRFHADGEVWQASLALGADPDALDLALSLCPPDGPCADLRADGTRTAPFAAVASLLQQVATTLDKFPAPGADAHWAAPLSKDDYASLMCGRAAATWYGLLPPVSPEDAGNPRKDPFARSVFLDPRMPLAWWLNARRHWQQGAWEDATEDLERARRLQSEKIIFQADKAMALQRIGRAPASLTEWDELRERVRRDPRFLAPRVQLLAALGRTQEADDLLNKLHARFQEDPVVLEVRANLASMRGDDPTMMALLERWRQLAVDDPAPVQRLIAAHLAKPDWGAVEALLPDLAARGLPDQAARLAIPLALERSDWDAALAAARQLDWPEAERRVALRRDMGNVSPVWWTAPEGGAPPLEQLARAQALLDEGNPTLALESVQAVLQGAPWLPEALAVQARCYRRLGKETEARQSQARLVRVDPEGLGARELALWPLTAMGNKGLTAPGGR